MLVFSLLLVLPSFWLLTCQLQAKCFFPESAELFLRLFTPPSPLTGAIEVENVPVELVTVDKIVLRGEPVDMGKGLADPRGIIIDLLALKNGQVERVNRVTVA